jgi:hypothetical protein
MKSCHAAEGWHSAWVNRRDWLNSILSLVVPVGRLRRTKKLESLSGVFLGDLAVKGQFVSEAWSSAADSVALQKPHEDALAFGKPLVYLKTRCFAAPGPGTVVS